MLTVCFGAKGGQGCSTVAAMLAMLVSRRNVGTVLVDCVGELPALLGVVDERTAGLADVLRSGERLTSLVDYVSSHGRMGLVTVGLSDVDDVSGDRWLELAQVLAASPAHWVLDAGTGPARAALAGADHAILVTTYCYLALRAAHRRGMRTTGVVTVREDGRALGVRDVERIVDAPVVAEIPWMPKVARSVDAGLLGGWRLSNQVTEPLGRLVAAMSLEAGR